MIFDEKDEEDVLKDVFFVKHVIHLQHYDCARNTNLFLENT